MNPPEEHTDPGVRSDRADATQPSDAGAEARESRIDETTAGEDGAHPLADVLELISRVRDQLPDCMADMLVDPEGVTQWLEPEADDAPTSIGRFEIKRRLGHGGFGLVFLAFDPQLERDVALKVPRIEALVTEVTRQRFLREAKAIGALSHRNIATVFESGQIGPVCYLATEYYAGGTLAELVERTKSLDPRPAACLAQALALATQHAHSRGILHRDLKPSNVLLDFDDQGQVDEALESPGGERLAAAARITDFGLAKPIDDQQGQTQSQAMVGTPAYMSPEQADSRHDDISTASDVYSLGAILYELITGRPPFKKDSVLATLNAVRRDPPEPLSRASPFVPRDLDAICMKCLEKSPEQRYRTAGDLADDLGRFLAGEPVQARQITTAARAARWCRRNPVSAALAGTILVGVTAIAVVSSVAYANVAQARNDLRDTNATLTQRNEELRLSRDEASQRLTQAREALDAQTSVVLEDLLKRQQVVTDEHREYLQSALASYEDFAAAEDQDRESREGVASAWSRVAEINARLGEIDEALEGHRQAFEHYQSLAGDFPEEPDYRLEVLKTQNRWHTLLKEIGRIEEAEAVALQAREQAENLVAGNPGIPDYQIHLAAMHGGLANIYNRTQRHQEAEAMLLRAREIQQQLAEAHPEVPEYRDELSRSNGNLGLTMLQQGRFAEAEPYLDQCLQIQRELLEEDPRNPSLRDVFGKTLQLYGGLLAMTDRPSEAEPVFRELLRVRRELVSEYPADAGYLASLIDAYMNLGVALAQDERKPEAAPLWAEALPLARRLIDVEPGVPRHLGRLGSLLVKNAAIAVDNEDLERAEILVEEGRAYLGQAIELTPRDGQLQRLLSEYYETAAKIHAELGRYDQAVEFVEQALQRPVHPSITPFGVARLLARASARAESDESLTPEERGALHAEFEERAVAALRQAIQAGFSDLEKLTTDEDLEALRQRPDVKELIATLQSADAA